MEKLSGCGNNGIAQVECSQTFRKKQRLKIEIPIGNKSLQRGRSELIRLLDELSGWIRCFWVVGFLLNPVGRAFPVDVTGGGQGRAL